MCRRKPPFWARQLLHRTDYIARQLEDLNMLVSVESDDLDALDLALDDATASLAAKIDALIAAASTPLPKAELAALQADVENLRALGAPAPVEPPAEPPVV